MGREIERKFLVTGDGWRQGVQHTVQLRDGLLSDCDGRKIRIRFYDGHATLTVKGPRSGITRDEFEYDIPAEDAETMLARHCLGGIVEKSRHHVAFGGHVWFVDEFRGLLAGTVFAEIELASEDTQFACPPWIGREVTGHPEFRQATMIAARQRFSRETG